jgi:hypothetical protein
MTPYATVEDIENLWRPLSPQEIERANGLLPVVSDVLRQEAYNRDRDLDEMIEKGKTLLTTAKSVCVDVISRILSQPTDQATISPTQIGGIDASAGIIYQSAGGGIFVKNSELKRLGLLRQKAGFIDLKI